MIGEVSRWPRRPWGQDRTLLGRWLGQVPAVGRPPYGAFDPAGGGARGGLTALAGWSATMSGDRIETWNGKPLSPGEIVILHWVPGLGRQLTVLLAAIRARHLNATPLTPASFAGIERAAGTPSVATDPVVRRGGSRRDPGDERAPQDEGAGGPGGRAPRGSQGYRHQGTRRCSATCAAGSVIARTCELRCCRCSCTHSRRG